MKKRLLIGLLSAGLVAAMLPGVASADTPFGYSPLFRCDGGAYVFGELSVEEWPPARWRDAFDSAVIDSKIKYLESTTGKKCTQAGLAVFRIPA